MESIPSPLRGHSVNTASKPIDGGLSTVAGATCPAPSQAHAAARGGGRVSVDEDPAACADELVTDLADAPVAPVLALVASPSSTRSPRAQCKATK